MGRRSFFRVAAVAALLTMACSSSDDSSGQSVGSASNTVGSGASGGAGGTGTGGAGGKDMGSGVIPPERRTDWTHAGVPGGIPNRTTVCATFDPGATADAINAAIAACENGVVFLNAGTYDVSGIQVYASNVTLRGAGADKTILKGQNIVNLGNGFNAAHGAAITSGGDKDSTSITVSSTRNVAVNTMIEIDRDDDPDVVVSTTGGTRNMRQVNLVTAVSGDTVTLQNPLLWDFNAGNPTIKWYFANTVSSGVEDLKLDHSGAGSGNNFLFQYCYGCWLKGVESYKPSGYHVTIIGTLNSEIRDSFIHDAQTYGADNGGLAVYGNASYGSNSNMKIENNIFDRTFPAIELQNACSGFVIGYNYSYGSMAAMSDAPVTWTFADNHGPHDMMNLWEGNIGEMFGSDGYFGGSSHGTALRNYITGHNPNFGTKDDPIRLNRLAYDYNIVGNVLGSDEEAPLEYAEDAEGCAGGPAIYRLGYPNIGNCSLTDVTGHEVPGGLTYPDAKVLSTLLRWGNYDYFNRSTQFEAKEIPAGVPVPPDQIIPDSFCYSSRPAWFGTRLPWPPIGPDVDGGNGDPSGHVNKIPAQVCWEQQDLKSGGAFNAATCFGP